MSDFNPRDHLRRLRGKGGDADYLDVKWRIVWLRHEHPEAAIETEKMAGGMESNYAEFRALVSIPGGGSATGYGSESKADFGDFIEKAETKAIGRAIAALGYGTQFVGNELDEGERIVDSPVDSKRPDYEGDLRPQAPILTDDQDKVLAQALDMAEAAETYGAAKALVLTLKQAATPGQWDEIKRQWETIRRKHYPQTTQAERPAAYAG